MNNLLIFSLVFCSAMLLTYAKDPCVLNNPGSSCIMADGCDCPTALATCSKSKTSGLYQCIPKLRKYWKHQYNKFRSTGKYQIKYCKKNTKLCYPDGCDSCHRMIDCGQATLAYCNPQCLYKYNPIGRCQFLE